LSENSKATAEAMPPLCVDLDGTLIKSDSLFDAACIFLRRHPLQCWKLAVWLSRGRANLKAEVARHAPLDAARLPYNAELLRYLQGERSAGRKIFLATGAAGPLAERVAEHLGIFDGVLASDRATNLTRGKKLARLKERFGAFDYIGNSRADLPLLATAREAMTANPTLGLRIGLRLRHIAVKRVFLDRLPLRIP
jgi:phosphoserine phosphatase